MTQTAQKPIQLTLDAMLAKFKTSFPNLVEPFEKLRPDLEAGKGAQALAKLIGCEVEVRDDRGFSTYHWTGRSGPFEMKVPKPFDPTPQRPNETQQQAQEQREEPVTPQEATQIAPKSLQGPEAQDDPPEVPEADSDSQNAIDGKEAAEPDPAPAAVPVQGLFAALAELLGDSTLLMTVAKTGEEGKEPVLTATVVPQGEEAFTPVCLTGRVSELDTHFVSALESKAESKKSLAEQVEALKAADKALEEAKKQEVDAKKKQTEQKKKAAEKKDEQTKAEEQKAEEQAETEKQQEPLF